MKTKALQLFGESNICALGSGVQKGRGKGNGVTARHQPGKYTGGGYPIKKKLLKDNYGRIGLSKSRIWSRAWLQMKDLVPGMTQSLHIAATCA